MLKVIMYSYQNIKDDFYCLISNIYFYLLDTKNILYYNIIQLNLYFNNFSSI